MNKQTIKILNTETKDEIFFKRTASETAEYNAQKFIANNKKNKNNKLTIYDLNNSKFGKKWIERITV